MPYNIGEALKKYRNDCGISVKEIVNILSQHGYKASDSTIYNWENNHSQPTPGALLTMCSAYGIKDVLTAFGYDGYNEDGSIQLTMREIELIEKYRDLDSHGKEVVDFVLNKEYDRFHNSEYIEVAARGGKYKVKRKDILDLAERMNSEPYEKDDDLC